MECTKGEQLKRLIADELVNCDTHFENDQMVKVLDICDKLGIPDMHEALKGLMRDYSTNPNSPIFYEACRVAREALAKGEGK